MFILLKSSFLLAGNLSSLSFSVGGGGGCKCSLKGLKVNSFIKTLHFAMTILVMIPVLVYHWKNITNNSTTFYIQECHTKK